MASLAASGDSTVMACRASSGDSTSMESPTSAEDSILTASLTGSEDSTSVVAVASEARWAGWRRPIKPRPWAVNTTRPCWLVIVQPMNTVPRSACFADGRVSRISTVAVSESPGRTGSSQRISAMPPEPLPSARDITASIHSRAHAEQVCQPLAISPPNGEPAAACGSVWKYWGSKR